MLLLYWYLYSHSIITTTTTTITTGIPNLISTDISEIKTTLHKNGKKLCKSINRYNKPAYHLKDFCCTDYTFISTVLAKALPDIIESKLILLYRGKCSCSSGGCSGGVVVVCYTYYYTHYHYYIYCYHYNYHYYNYYR